MPNSRPQEFRGRLTPENAAVGINLAAKNARRLASDARLLLEAERVPTAASIAALSIEEAGKVSILRGLIIDISEPEVKAEWKRYRDHRSKNGHWILPSLAAGGARTLGAFSDVVNRESEHTETLNIVKQLGFYSDCYGEKCHWSDPQAVVSRELAEDLVKTAEVLAPKKDVTVRELQLWQQHLGPVWKTAEMSHALLRWAAAMNEEGLTETTAAEFEAFVFGKAGTGNWPGRKEH
jgi:AbiV family abortive infection protein